MTGRALTTACSAVPILAILFACGCIRLHPVDSPPLIPSLDVQIDRMRDSDSVTRVYTARWTIATPGSQLSHVIWALDPASIDRVDGTWRRCRKDSLTLSCSRFATHVFAVRAINVDGQMSDPWWTLLPADPRPPEVHIVSPTGGSIVSVTSPFVIEWEGHDGEGRSPVYYVYRLFGQRNPDYPNIADFVAFATDHPDSLNALYPTLAGWTWDVRTFSEFTAPPGERLFFAITCVDKNGLSDPSFEIPRNALTLEVLAASPAPTHGTARIGRRQFGTDEVVSPFVGVSHGRYSPARPRDTRFRGPTRPTLYRRRSPG